MERSNSILLILKQMYPDAHCELNYNNLFELLIAISLSSQTTDKRVNEVTKDLFKKYPSCQKLAKASEDDIYQHIKSLGLAKTKTRNIITLSNQLVTLFNGIVPSNRSDLEKLAGVGRKTANALLLEGYRIPEIPVDTHVKRIANRLGIICSDDVIEIENRLKKLYDKDEWYYVHHTMLFFGRYFCKAINPSCTICPLKSYCVYDK